jgi:hypothetical protein
VLARRQVHRGEGVAQVVEANIAEPNGSTSLREIVLVKLPA